MDCKPELVMVPVTDVGSSDRPASARCCGRSAGQLVSEPAGQEAGR
jgi:hypothetical protein